MAKDSVYITLGRQRIDDTLEGESYEIEVNGEPQDLTGVDIKCEFRFQAPSGSVSKSLTIGDGITVTDLEGGVFQRDAFILDFECGRHVYDFEFTYPDGRVKTYIYGDVTAFKDVTK